MIWCVVVETFHSIVGGLGPISTTDGTFFDQFISQSGINNCAQFCFKYSGLNFTSFIDETNFLGYTEYMIFQLFIFCGKFTGTQFLQEVWLDM